MEDIIKISKRTEAEVFLDLENLCKSSGYIYYLAYLCYQNNHIFYNEEITSGDVMKIISSARFTNSEISTLVGLMIKTDIDFTLPDKNTFKKYMDATKLLLHELHVTIQPPIPLNSEGIIDPDLLKAKKFLREAIIYGPETSYSFQYNLFAQEKYKNDHKWFLENKNFTPNDVFEVIKCIQEIQQQKFDALLFIKKGNPKDWNKFEDFLEAFILTKKEIYEKSGISTSTTESILNSFCVTSIPSNLNFNRVDDLNEINFRPLILLKDQTFLLFQFYRLTQSFYESPFYWMYKDTEYRDQAGDNRGNFTEEFTAKKLAFIP